MQNQIQALKGCVSGGRVVCQEDCDSPSEEFALDSILLCREKERDIWWYKATFTPPFIR